MRFETVSQSKGISCGTPQMIPREGTHIRTLYDLLMANKGVPINIAICMKFDGHGTQLNYLRDFYGLDIRRLANRRWVLAGEWFGKTYVDYIADRVHAADRKRGRV